MLSRRNAENISRRTGEGFTPLFLSANDFVGSRLRTISRHHRLHRHHYDNWFINGRTAIGEPAESVAPLSLFLSSLLFSLFIIVRTLFPLFRLLRLNSPFHGWRCTAARTAKTAKDMTRSGKVIDCRQHDSVPVFLLLRPDFFVSIFYILIRIVHLSISLRAVKFVDRDTFRRESKFRVQPLTKPTTVLLSLLFTSSLLITVLRAWRQRNLLVWLLIRTTHSHDVPYWSALSKTAKILPRWSAKKNRTS